MKAKKKKIKAKKKIKPKARPKIKGKIKEGKPVAKVTHYFSDISVVGGEDTDFNQKIVSMQVDHEQVMKAKKGVSIGLKVKHKVREGYRVFKV